MMHLLRSKKHQSFSKGLSTSAPGSLKSDALINCDFFVCILHWDKLVVTGDNCKKKLIQAGTKLQLIFFLKITWYQSTNLNVTFLPSSRQSEDMHKYAVTDMRCCPSYISIVSNLVPRVFVPLDQRSKTRALGAIILNNKGNKFHARKGLG